jgi:hypothetical protein
VSPSTSPSSTIKKVDSTRYLQVSLSKNHVSVFSSHPDQASPWAHRIYPTATSPAVNQRLVLAGVVADKSRSNSRLFSLSKADDRHLASSMHLVYSVIHPSMAAVMQLEEEENQPYDPVKRDIFQAYRCVRLAYPTECERNRRLLTVQEERRRILH